MLNPILGTTNTNASNVLTNAASERQISYNPEMKKQVENKTSAGIEKKDINKIDDCKSCSERKYQDVSDDGGVSFQSAQKVGPGQAASAVMGHEREHYSREQSKADREDRKVVSNEIKIKHAICPECGKTYVSGGETRTVTKGKSPSQKALAKNEVKGINFDAKV